MKLLTDSVNADALGTRPRGGDQALDGLELRLMAELKSLMMNR
jgi:hypothetical protein